ncbi:MAG: heavy metal-associated domain-containing protein, partial [Candidatus Roizmanbacteria bacterium]|nr:heavy metal-associated domain-containing protein [Candidatus Roizmanbacteria bacterium]
MQTKTIKLSGLTCPACKKVTEKRISGIEGVIKVEVTINSGVAAIEANKKITILEIKEVLKDT